MKNNILFDLLKEKKRSEIEHVIFIYFIFLSFSLLKINSVDGQACSFFLINSLSNRIIIFK